MSAWELYHFNSKAFPHVLLEFHLFNATFLCILFSCSILHFPHIMLVSEISNYLWVWSHFFLSCSLKICPHLNVSTGPKHLSVRKYECCDSALYWFEMKTFWIFNWHLLDRLVIKVCTATFLICVDVNMTAFIVQVTRGFLTVLQHSWVLLNAINCYLILLYSI